MKAIILAGGRGSRLDPYTTVLPKPLMPIGNIPIIEIVIRQLRHAGFDAITLAVGYLAELLMAYLGDGTKFGVHIHYSREEHPLGTAGPLSLLEELDEPFVVMNGDLLTTLDYRALWEQHCANGAIATLATYRRDVKIDLGVIESDALGQVKRYIEKPTYHYNVSTGIYVFEPAVLGFIPQTERMDLPDLILKLVASGEMVATYPFNGIWLDIGQSEDYREAVAEFEQHTSEFLPEQYP